MIQDTLLIIRWIMNVLTRCR